MVHASGLTYVKCSIPVDRSVGFCTDVKVFGMLKMILKILLQEREMRIRV